MPSQVLVLARVAQRGRTTLIFAFPRPYIRRQAWRDHEKAPAHFRLHDIFKTWICAVQTPEMGIGMGIMNLLGRMDFCKPVATLETTQIKIKAFQCWFENLEQEKETSCCSVSLQMNADAFMFYFNAPFRGAVPKRHCQNSWVAVPGLNFGTASEDPFFH